MLFDIESEAVLSMTDYAGKRPTVLEVQVPSIEQRLDELSAKVDAMLDRVALREADEDKAWHSISLTPPAPALALVPHQAVVDQGDFAKALSRRNQRRRQLLTDKTKAQWTPELEAKVELEMGPLEDHLHRIAWALTDGQTSAHADRIAKALAILEFAEENSNDLVHRLAVSLATDLLDQSV
jgi:hypothetical protein